MPKKLKKGDQKFKVKSDLAIFEALQEDGKLSEGKIAKKTKIPPTTVHYALERLKKRHFFDIAAIPKLSGFENEIPMAVIGFNSVTPKRLERVKKEHGNRDTTLMFLYGEKEVVMFLISTDKDRLTKKLFEIMEILNSKPSIYIISPQVAKCDVRVPKRVLEGIFNDLTDRKGRSN